MSKIKVEMAVTDTRDLSRAMWLAVVGLRAHASGSVPTDADYGALEHIAWLATGRSMEADDALQAFFEAHRDPPRSA